MIDYLIPIHRNYELLNLQLKNFKLRFSEEEYRLIIVDNTFNYKQKITIDDPKINHLILSVDCPDSFDGASHGCAINYGLQYCQTPIVCIMDSDFFILNKNIHQYVFNIFDQGYKAVGCEWNDGDGTKNWVKAYPEKFINIPYLFCAYYDLNLAKSAPWGITEQEARDGSQIGYISTDWKIRKNIVDNKIKTCDWKTDATSYGNCYFRNENQEMMGFHFGAGSHRRWNENSKSEIESIIQKNFGHV